MTDTAEIPSDLTRLNLLPEIRHLLFDGRDGDYAHLKYTYGRQSLLFMNAGVTIDERDIEIFTRREYPNICLQGPGWKMGLNWGGVPETIEHPRVETFEGDASACQSDLLRLRLYL